MIAATQKNIFELEAFRLVLSMCALEEKNIPAEMKEFFNTVLAQAKTLATNPSNVSSGTLPEAIDLALEIQSSSEISSNVSAIENYEGLTPALASTLLNKMENCSVCQN